MLIPPCQAPVGSPQPPPSSSHPHTEGFSLYSITSLHHNPVRAQNWKGNRNSQLNMGLTVVGHLQAIQRKTTRGNISILALQAYDLKITLPLSAIDDFP